jgi:hypothetical protein
VPELPLEPDQASGWPGGFLAFDDCYDDTVLRRYGTTPLHGCYSSWGQEGQMDPAHRRTEEHGVERGKDDDTATTVQ